jgi:hypothetical protein
LEKATVKGSCLCGKVSYKVSPPYSFFHYCHCGRCRKNTGSIHSANILVNCEQFKWSKGEDLVQNFDPPSAKHFRTAFCEVCGSSMPWPTKNGKFFLIPAGTLDDDPIGRPERNIYWNSKAKWCTDVSKLPTFSKDA